MPLHAQTAIMLQRLAAGPEVDFTDLDVATFRAAFAVPAPSARTEIGPIVEHIIAGAAGPMRLRTYAPLGEGPFPITLYLPGGGFVIGDSDTTDGICRRLARHGGTLVVSVDGRLAPEAPFPCALEDAHAALCWVHAHAASLNGVSSAIAVAGDSSGGNLAAVLAQMSRTRGPEICHQLLLYPALDCRFDTASYRAFAKGYFLTEAMMRWYWRQYLPDGASPDDIRISPARNEALEGLPSATIVTAEYDVLRDEAEAYARALGEARVAVTLRRWEGQIHGFLLMEGDIDDAALALQHAGESLRQAFELLPLGGCPSVQNGLDRRSIGEAR
ncbi:alpha/beta hydrolase [Pendulispora rubella]|uniref:Alpha/beta hydrolase n=1 Tax=Pendulispora rubella TaxID=2741070 RepID=A0ABZ2KRS0_9BACT